MKILMLGKNGQVGRALQMHLPALNAKLITLAREHVDFSDSWAIKKALLEYSPDIIVNAVAYTAVDKAEQEEDLAYQINAEALKPLSAYAKSTGSLLLHYSSDYVFDGEKERPYIETDPTNPQNVYGRTKRIGEEIILDSGCAAFIFRTSWVYSAHGNNFVKTILRLAAERENLNVVDDQIGAPTSADFIAKVSTEAISKYVKEGSTTTGLFHLTAAGSTSWHGFASHIVQCALNKGLSLKLNADNIHPIATHKYPLPAKRPKNSCLNTDSFRQTFNTECKDWDIESESVIKKLLQGHLNNFEILWKT